MVRAVYLFYEFISEQGGLEREMINNANFLLDEGYDVKILTCHFNKDLLKSHSFGKIKVEEIGKTKTGIEALDLFLCLMGYNNLDKYNPSLFISYSFPCNFMLRKKQSKKLIYINHLPNFLYAGKNSLWEWAFGNPGIKRWLALGLATLFGRSLKKMDKFYVNQSSKIFSNSYFTKKKVDQVYGLNSIVMYPPVSSDFKPSSRKMRQDYVFSAGRIVPDKKFEWLIDIMALSKCKLPLFISGACESKYKKILQKRAVSLGIKLTFLGKLKTSTLVDYYSSARVVAFPTPGEDFGLIPAESLSCGTPVIAWGDGAGPTEQIVDGVNGFLALPYNKLDFAEKLDRTISLNLKEKHEKKILQSAEKFSYGSIKKNFISSIKQVI